MPTQRESRKGGLSTTKVTESPLVPGATPAAAEPEPAAAAADTSKPDVALVAPDEHDTTKADEPVGGDGKLYPGWRHDVEPVESTEE